jgi:hypothetical protein
MQVKPRLGHPPTDPTPRGLYPKMSSLGIPREQLGRALGAWVVGVIENGDFTPLGVEPKPGEGPLGTVPE